MEKFPLSNVRLKTHMTHMTHCHSMVCAKHWNEVAAATTAV